MGTSDVCCCLSWGTGHTHTRTHAHIRQSTTSEGHNPTSRNQCSKSKQPTCPGHVAGWPPSPVSCNCWDNLQSDENVRYSVPLCVSPSWETRTESFAHQRLCTELAHCPDSLCGALHLFNPSIQAADRLTSDRDTIRHRFWVLSPCRMHPIELRFLCVGLLGFCHLPPALVSSHFTFQTYADVIAGRKGKKWKMNTGHLDGPWADFNGCFHRGVTGDATRNTTCLFPFGMQGTDF